MNRRSTILPALAALLALGLAGGAAADTLLTVKTHVDAVQMGGMRQDARDLESTIWLGEQKVRRDDGQVSSILRLDKNKMYVLDHARKVYNVFDMPIDFKKLYPQGGEEMQARASDMSKMDVTVTPREEKRKIGDWNARRYDVVMTNAMGMKVETTMWVSKDVGVDVSALTRMAGAMTALKPGTLDWMKKMEELEGFPVLQEATVTMMGTPIKSTEHLVSVEKKEAPAGTYEPPAGYKEKPFDPTHPMIQ